MLPERDQLSSYMNEQMRAWNELVLAPMMGAAPLNDVKGKATNNFYGYPVNYVTANNYAGLSTAPTSDGTGPEISGASDIGGGAADGAAGSY